MMSDFKKSRFIAKFPKRERKSYQYCQKDKQTDRKLEYLFESYWASW